MFSTRARVTSLVLLKHLWCLSLAQSQWSCLTLWRPGFALCFFLFVFKKIIEVFTWSVFKKILHDFVENDFVQIHVPLYAYWKFEISILLDIVEVKASFENNMQAALYLKKINI